MPTAKSPAKPLWARGVPSTHLERLGKPESAGDNRGVQLVQIRTQRRSGAQSRGSSEPLVDADLRSIRYLRLSLTDRCNYRCTYCRPAEGLHFGPRSDLLNFDEIERLVGVFARRGVVRVRLTGGEPTLRQDLPSLVAGLKCIKTVKGTPLEVVMTTNGDLLAPLAQSLFDAGLDGLTVSIDALDPERFSKITRGAKVQRVFDGLLAATAAGFTKIKLNTVAIAGFNDHEIADLAAFAWAHGHIPRFIELMPMSQGELFVPGTLMSASQIRDRLAQAHGAKLEARPAAKNSALGPARYWRLAGGAHDGAHFGVIAAMTENFCDACNRLRVSAQGQVHACLANDESGDLKTALRSGDYDSLDSVIASVLRSKRPRHLFELDGKGGPTKAMISIGG